MSGRADSVGANKVAGGGLCTFPFPAPSSAQQSSRCMLCRRCVVGSLARDYLTPYSARRPSVWRPTLLHPPFWSAPVLGVSPHLPTPAQVCLSLFYHVRPPGECLEAVSICCVSCQRRHQKQQQHRRHLPSTRAGVSVLQSFPSPCLPYSTVSGHHSHSSTTNFK